MHEILQVGQTGGLLLFVFSIALRAACRNTCFPTVYMTCIFMYMPQHHPVCIYRLLVTSIVFVIGIFTFYMLWIGFSCTGKTELSLLVINMYTYICLIASDGPILPVVLGYALSRVCSYCIIVVSSEQKLRLLRRPQLISFIVQRTLNLRILVTLWSTISLPRHIQCHATRQQGCSSDGRQSPRGFQTACRPQASRRKDVAH